METAITTQLKIELGIAQGKIKDLEQENAALKAVLGRAKIVTSVYAGIAEMDDLNSILSTVPKVLAVVDTDVLGDDNDSPIVWIGVPDETPIPTDVTVVVLEKGGE